MSLHKEINFETEIGEQLADCGWLPAEAQRHLGHFVELGLLRRVGRGPATEYLKPEYVKL